ncbi:RlpA-like double-psi beta-barrel domain-containing protein [Streptomyces sp. NPDC090077]|uniref:RlpA-like double-psi beta-barrel domain-containing protein n=1 Tax=Streptomyces sp. NPDC090077 TaxID=3365938 RepID=UPI0037FD5D8D
MKARIATAAAAVAVLAAGTGAVITGATASASETAAASAQAAVLAPQAGGTTAAPAPGGTTAPPPNPGRTTAPPPKPGTSHAPSGSPQPGRTTTPPPTPKPGKTTTASPQPGKPGETYKGSATHYSPGLGACGKVIKDTDHAVALDPTMFGNGYPSASCGRKVVITYKGKSVTATVLDEAPGAGRHGLDLTPGTFKALAPLDKGKIDVTWRFAK